MKALFSVLSLALVSCVKPPDSASAATQALFTEQASEPVPSGLGDHSPAHAETTLNDTLPEVGGDTGATRIDFACSGAGCDSGTGNYSFAVEIKMYIDEITESDCQASKEDLGLQRRKRMFLALCRHSALDQKRVPMNGQFTSPPNARISARYTVEFRCEQGQRTPTSASISLPRVVAGHEAFLRGKPFDSRIKNTVDSDGGFVVIVGGHPNPITEPMMRRFGARENTDVWLRTAGNLDCGPETSPDATAELVFDSTDFPSQKVWITTEKQTELVWTKPQGLFSKVWAISPTPAP